jgi:hypothetical protein
MKTCEIKDAFGIEALKFSERPDPPLQHGQVRIRVRAWLTDKSRRGSFPCLALMPSRALNVTSRQVQDGKDPSAV